MTKLAGIPAETGHNSADQRLKTIVERVERLEEEKKDLVDDIKEVYSEAKSNGYDVKALRKIVSERKKDPAKKAIDDQMFLFLWEKVQ